MKASIVVPVRNNEEMIGDCIESLLAQDFPKDDYEIIVVDNKSTDKTADIIKRYPVKYVYEDKIGRTKARNTGIKNSSGEIIAFIDSDCVAEKNWLNELVKGFKNKRVGGVGGKNIGYKTSTYVERYIEIYYKEYNKNFTSYVPPKVMTNNAAYRFDVLEEIGYFDESFETGEDFDLSARTFWNGYEVDYASAAVVFHRHRSSFRELFNLYFEYGVGYVRFLNKHRARFSNNRNERGTTVRLYYRILTDKEISPDIKTKMFFCLCMVIQTIAFFNGKTYERIQRRL